MTTEEKTPAQLQARAEKKLKSLKKRINAALLALENPSAERLKNLIARAKLERHKAFEKQRAAIIDALPEQSRKIMDLSSPEFLIGKTEVQMRMICGLPATDGKATVSPGLPEQESILEPADAEASAGTDTDKPAVPDGGRRGRPRT